MKKSIIILLAISWLIFQLSMTGLIVADPPMVVGVAGTVKTTAGVPIVAATVNITNLNTSESVVTLTAAGGWYAAGITAQDDNILVVNATMGLYSGSSNTTVNTSDVTQYCNITTNLTIALAADFHYTPSSLVDGEQVHFTDQSIGAVVSWLWVFGDGSTGVGRNIDHVFAEPGSYTVFLTVDDGLSNDTYSEKIQVELNIGQGGNPENPNQTDGEITSGNKIFGIDSAVFMNVLLPIGIMIGIVIFVGLFLHSKRK